ncbi:terpenoid synthase [Epithele typhae]|uniref:terpenoid synthase n=1 Tax=Epithele typhae TaxID=378194 RepID=UPI0020087195|nr:terpenoid synthase [Epithele typhae]KAH9918907.1 terpenoid synthase [Epithele typhae]
MPALVASHPSFAASVLPLVKQVQDGLLDHATSNVPVLTQLSQYYLLMPCKLWRPSLTLLMCQATNGLGSNWQTVKAQAAATPSELNDDVHNILPTQVRLAQIIEILHVASLLHDDVIDNADTRRGHPSLPAVSGNRRAILAGDFLVGRTIVLASALGSPEVTLLLAQLICTLVEGELLQSGDLDPARARAVLGAIAIPPAPGAPARLLEADAEAAAMWETYLKKSYMKTSSIFEVALECGAVLGGAAPHDAVRAVVRLFGACLGMASQLMNDVAEFEQPRSSAPTPTPAPASPSDQPDAELKPAPAAPAMNDDLENGLVTGPVFFALDEDPSLRPLVLRRFSEPGDAAQVAAAVQRTHAVARTRAFAKAYVDRARETLAELPASTARAALEDMAAGFLFPKAGKS